MPPSVGILGKFAFSPDFVIFSQVFCASKKSKIIPAKHPNSSIRDFWDSPQESYPGSLPGAPGSLARSARITAGSARIAARSARIAARTAARAPISPPPASLFGFLGLGGPRRRKKNRGKERERESLAWSLVGPWPAHWLAVGLAFGWPLAWP